jgi:hypothetical protein
MNVRTTSSGLIAGEFSGGVTIRPADVISRLTAERSGTEDLSARRTKALDRSAGKDHPWWWD